MILIKWKSDPVFLPLWHPLFLTRKSSQLLRAKLLFTVSPLQPQWASVSCCKMPSSLQSPWLHASCALYLVCFIQLSSSQEFLFTLGFSMTPRQEQYSWENFSLYFSLQFFTAVVPNVFLVPGTSFMEDYFSTHWGVWCGGRRGMVVEMVSLRMIQVHYIYCSFISITITSAPPQIIGH